MTATTAHTHHEGCGHCEGCGKPGAAVHDDPYAPGEGYPVEMCDDCISDQRRQADIDRADWAA